LRPDTPKPIKIKPSTQWGRKAAYANAIGSTIEGSSFSGLLTRVEIGHIRMGFTDTLAARRSARVTASRHATPLQ
jgi:hypothetical protein